MYEDESEIGRLKIIQSMLGIKPQKLTLPKETEIYTT